MTNTNTLDQDVRALTAFDSWDEMKACLSRGPRQYGYTPTLHPESPAHVRLRRAVLKEGGSVWPKPQVKLTGVTGAQMHWLDDYLMLSEESSDKRVSREAKRAVTTKTTVTMSLDLALDFVEWLDHYKQDAIENAGCGDARTESEIQFAEWSVQRSFEALTKKVNKAIRKAK